MNIPGPKTGVPERCPKIKYDSFLEKGYKDCDYISLNYEGHLFKYKLHL
jgi:hypothetical protein